MATFTTLTSPDTCKKCSGSGKFTSWAGRVVGDCFACNGTGKTTQSPVAFGKGERTIKNGTYTVNFNGSHRTIRIKPHWLDDEAKAGKQIAQFLSGPDNDSDYTGFAFVNGDTYRVWKKFAGNYDLGKSLSYLLKADNEARKAAGMSYAMESGNCYICGRTLTTPESIELGIGPVCASKGY